MLQAGTKIAVSVLAIAAIAGSPTLAQSTSGSNGQTVLPFAEPHFKGNVGTTFKDSDPAAFPKAVKAPEGAPTSC
jgi:hypothetical protein